MLGLRLLIEKGLFLEWILQNKAGHLMVFTQCSILNRVSPVVDENRSPFVSQRTEGIELHFGQGTSVLGVVH